MIQVSFYKQLKLEIILKVHSFNDSTFDTEIQTQ
jgi:hypothetical protein